jgi:hypothetical protein
VFGVAGTFGGRGKLPEGSYRVMASRIAEHRIGSDTEQQSDRPRCAHSLDPQMLGPKRTPYRRCRPPNRPVPAMRTSSGDRLL